MWFLCDRCSGIYQPHPDWPRNPLCPACLIGLRRDEMTCNSPSMTTAREIETAWRKAAWRQWQDELAV